MWRTHGNALGSIGFNLLFNYGDCMNTWTPGYRKEYERIDVSASGVKIITSVNNGVGSEEHLLKGNCFPVGTLNEAHTHEIEETIRSFGNAKTGG